jgi:hypothetical protein
MAKPYNKILLWSAIITVFIYLVDIYLLDPIAPDPSWRYRISNFLICFVMYTGGFFIVFSFVYICYKTLTKLLRRSA